MKHLSTAILIGIAAVFAMALGYSLGQHDEGEVEQSSSAETSMEAEASSDDREDETSEWSVQASSFTKKNDVEPLSQFEADAQSVGYSWEATMPLSVNK